MWLKDTAAALREHKIGCAMWDSCGGFALATGTPGSRQLDQEVVKVLTK